jgi:hypothetical protein
MQPNLNILLHLYFISKDTNTFKSKKMRNPPTLAYLDKLTKFWGAICPSDALQENVNNLLNKIIVNDQDLIVYRYFYNEFYISCIVQSKAATRI